MRENTLNYARPRARSTIAMLCLLGTAGMTLAPAQVDAATRPTVTVASVPSSVQTGSTVGVRGSVSGRTAGAAVTLQRYDSGAWRVVGGGSTVTASRTFALSLTAVEGQRSYRVRVAPTSRTVAAASAVFRVTGTTPTSTPSPTPAPSPSPSPTSSPTPTPSPSTAPTPTPTPTPSAQEIGVQRILDDTNAFRTSQGLAPLKLSTEMNTVAQRWAQYLHDSGTFQHNPTYSREIPPGWRRAAENIAAGQSYDTVVRAWINSDGHRANLLCDCTHIGIGYVDGTKGYKRYFVQNFAKY